MTLRMGMLNIYQEERRASSQLSDEKGMNNFKNSKYNRYKCKLVLITYKLFDQKSAGTFTITKTGINFENQQ